MEWAEEQDKRKALAQLMSQAGYPTTWGIRDGDVWLYSSVYVGNVEEVLKMTPDEIVAIDETYLHNRFEE